MQAQKDSDTLTYVPGDEPDVPSLQKAYTDTIAELNDYFEKCQDSFDERRNYWPGKSKDLRKHGADAFPWEGASDIEVHVIGERVLTMVALCMTALSRANIRAYPSNSSNAARSAILSSFLKYLIQTYIPGFKREAELACNYGFERGLIISYVGWERSDTRYLQGLDIAKIRETAPQVADAIINGNRDDEVIELMRAKWPMLENKAAKKALKALRAKGVAELPVIQRKVDRPCVQACAPDEDVFFPPYCTDPQKAPYVFYRQKLTAQEILNRVQTAGWDKDWAEEIIEKYAGVEDAFRPNQHTRREIVSGARADTDLYDIVRIYQRLVDPDDGSQGIYCTIVHPRFAGRKEIQGYAKHELLNGYEDYPFVVTRLSADNARMYDMATVPEILRGLQQGIKVERDSRIDRNSMATMPAMFHPPGRVPPNFGPGAKVGVSRSNEITWAPTPPFNPGSVEIEKVMLETADKILGLDFENPMSAAKRQFYLEKFLTHVQEVVKAAYKSYQRFGPDSLFFHVTGAPDTVNFDKGDPTEDVQVFVMFDVLSTDSEYENKKMESFVNLLSLDKNGRMDVDRLIEFSANKIDPVLADAVLQPVEVAQQKIVREVTDDLSKIYAGIEVGARPNGAQIAMQIIQQYTQQPDIANRLQQDKSFAQRLQKYASQYVFALQQMQNAQIGRTGTAPASVGTVGTQTANNQQ